MKALLIKDLLTSKGLLKNYLLIIAIYGGVAYMNDNVFLFSGMLLMIPMLMALNSVAYDEKASTLRLMVASGLTRKQLALSKYLFGAVMLVAVFAINFVVVTIAEGALLGLLTSILFCFVGMTYLSLLLPFLYHFGTEKSRIFMMLGVIIPVALGTAVSSLFQLLNLHLSDLALVSGGFVLGVVVIAVSMISSIKILEKKDM
ncbi:MAG: ABC-2 transporter permease [Erysipelotrichaceae bacterium]|nr:ABC-2 transporter permease [Erysipelotrichaceae bacterium]